MASNRRIQRERLFDLYVRNLSFHRPNITGNFACPICLRLFTRAALDGSSPEIDLGHIFPKSVGGRRCILICRYCNSFAGWKYDQHLKREGDVQAWSDGTQAKRAWINLPDGQIAVEWNRTTNGQVLDVREGQSSPRAVEKLKTTFKKTGEFNVTTDWYSSRGCDIALMHSAFLMMFWQFGYEYVLSENPDCIRKVIQEKADSNRFKKSIWQVPRWSTCPLRDCPDVSVLAKPKQLQCFLVVLPSPQRNQARIVLLPGFGELGRETFENVLALDRPPSTMHPIGFRGDPRTRLVDEEQQTAARWLWGYAERTV